MSRFPIYLLAILLFVANTLESRVVDAADLDRYQITPPLRSERGTASLVSFYRLDRYTGQMWKCSLIKRPQTIDCVRVAEDAPMTLDARAPRYDVYAVRDAHLGLSDRIVRIDRINGHVIVCRLEEPCRTDLRIEEE